jgi:hypothetical protein
VARQFWGVSVKQAAQKEQALTIESKPYLYPCSIATREDFARIWGLDDEKVGTLTETRALAAKNVKGGSDISKLAPSSTTKPRFSTNCSYSLAKKGASSVNSIDITLVQFASDEDAKVAFKTMRSTASRDYTFDGIDNGTRQLTTLPSFTAENSYVQQPEPTEGIHTEKAAFVVGSRMVELAYSLEDNESVETVTPFLGEYAQTIKKNMDSAPAAVKPVDLTGQNTFVGKKLVDLCSRADLPELARVIGGVEFRPDEAINISSYGALKGSRAAADGAYSHCTYEFNTDADRQAQNAIEKKTSTHSTSELTSDMKWPHKITIGVNTFISADEAKAALAAKKAQASKPFKGVSPTIESIKGIGDVAYKYHKETAQITSFGGVSSEMTFIDDSYVVVKESDMFTINLQQLAEEKAYKTAPLTITDDKFKNAYQLTLSTVSDNRK